MPFWDKSQEKSASWFKYFDSNSSYLKILITYPGLVGKSGIKIKSDGQSKPLVPSKKKAFYIFFSFFPGFVL
jgi:hypothetical protein